MTEREATTILNNLDSCKRRLLTALKVADQTADKDLQKRLNDLLDDIEDLMETF